MAKTRRAQVRMEPEEHALLEEVARQMETSVAELFRTAVRRCYLAASANRMALVEDLARLEIPLPDWGELEREIEERHDGGLH